MANEFNQLPNPQSGNVQAAVASALAGEKKKKRKKKLIIIAVIIAVIVVIGIISGSGKEGKKVESIDGKTTAAQSVDAGNGEEQEGEVKVKVGNAVTSDELKISFVSCDTNSKNYNKYLKPDKGNKLVRAEFKFENVSSSDVILNNIDCYADDKKCDSYYSADDYASPTLESVSPGRSFNAVVYYQVPENSKTIEFEYEDNMWTDEKTVFVAE